MLVEPSAYSVDATYVGEIPAETETKKRKGGRRRRSVKGGWKKAKAKGYAKSHGRHRGGRNCDDKISPCNEPAFNPDDPTEGIYLFVQTTHCRRKVSCAVFDGPEPSKFSVILIFLTLTHERTVVKIPQNRAANSSIARVQESNN